MLDKKSKKVLKVVNKIESELHSTNCPAVIAKYLPKYTSDTIEEVLWYLHSIGYLHCFSADNTIIDIVITYKGKNYVEFNWLEFKNFIYKSVLVPIIVSIATTLIIKFIQ